MRIKTSPKARAGFTLVEIAIVMVIIGLLIGGVLKGQAMIENAKVKRLVKQTDEFRAAVMAFYDKYGQYPGDENVVGLPISDTNEGDGDGTVEANEDEELFEDLQKANLISGSFDGTNLPYHAFGDTITMYWLNPLGGGPKHWFLLNNLPAEICQEIDTKYDDGNPASGSVVNAGGAAYTPGSSIANFYILF